VNARTAAVGKHRAVRFFAARPRIRCFPTG
jgi:hypothetical protein